MRNEPMERQLRVSAPWCCSVSGERVEHGRQGEISIICRCAAAHQCLSDTMSPEPYHCCIPSSSLNRASPVWEIVRDSLLRVMLSRRNHVLYLLFSSLRRPASMQAGFKKGPAHGKDEVCFGFSISDRRFRSLTLWVAAMCSATI